MYKSDFGPVDRGCGCVCCRTREKGGLGITRAYIHHVAAKETAGAHLLTMHNVHYLLHLMERMREAITRDEFPDFIRDFFGALYQGDKTRYPAWAIDSLRTVGVDLLAG